MDKMGLKQEIIDLIAEKMGTDKKRLEKYASENSLMDEKIGLQPRDLLTLFFLLQQRYKVKFEENDIINKRFDYLENIAEAILQKVV